MSSSEEPEDISALWQAAIQRQEFEPPPERPEMPMRRRRRRKVRVNDDDGLISPQEMNLLHLDARVQRSRDGAEEGESYDYYWDEDDNLVFSEKMERGRRIDCWLGFEKKGSILRLSYQSYLTDETEAGETLVVLGSWEWHREMCKPPGGYNIMRNYWGESEGVPETREAIKNGHFDDNDDDELGSNWAQLTLAMFGDENG